MSKRQHNTGTLAETEGFVLRYFPALTTVQRNLYFIGVRILERRNGGIFRPITEDEETWRRVSGPARKKVREGREELQALGLIHLTPGNNGSDGSPRRKATVRRCSIEEIRNGVDAEILNRFVPADIEALAAEIEERGIPWNGDLIRPRWNVALTGRLNHSSSPLTAPRTNTKTYRLKAFRRSLAEDEELIEADWKAAEPTVLCDVLAKRGLLGEEAEPESIYEALQTTTGCNNKKAKKLFQSVAYSAYKHISVPDTWKLPSGHFLFPLVEAIEAYRQHLWSLGTPRNGEPRFVHTLTGRKIIHDRKKRMHRGKPLAWQIQGTVADIFAKAVKQVLEDDANGLCRFFFPCHDAVYVAVKQGSDYDPAAVMKRYADEVGIPLRAETETYTPLNT